MSKTKVWPQMTHWNGKVANHLDDDEIIVPEFIMNFECGEMPDDIRPLIKGLSVGEFYSADDEQVIPEDTPVIQIHLLSTPGEEQSNLVYHSLFEEYEVKRVCIGAGKSDLDGLDGAQWDICIPIKVFKSADQLQETLIMVAQKHKAEVQRILDDIESYDDDE